MVPAPPDTPDSLQRSLARLQQELAGAPRLDDQAKQRLRAALADIEQRIVQRGERPVAPAPAAESSGTVPPGSAPGGSSSHPLEALAVGFETDHPSLAASVRQFIDLLGQAGL
jgi:Domain of unknown function (DUF4404)